MIFTCIYALTGVACLGIALGIIGSNLMDAQEKAVSKTREMTQVKVLSVFGGGGGTATTTTRSSNDDDSSKNHNNESDNPPEDNTDDQDDDDAFTAPPSCMGFFLHAIPLLTVLFGLAYWIGLESEWDLERVIYYAIITATTVGFGDLAPRTEKGKLIATIFIPLAAGAMGQWLTGK